MHVGHVISQYDIFLSIKEVFPWSLLYVYIRMYLYPVSVPRSRYMPNWKSKYSLCGGNVYIHNEEKIIYSITWAQWNFLRRIKCETWCQLQFLATSCYDSIVKMQNISSAIICLIGKDLHFFICSRSYTSDKLARG